MTSIIKWAGGKKQLLEILKENMPSDIKTYVEPFFGSGALFFAINPEKAVINDVNKELINLYAEVKTEPDKLRDCALKIENEYNSLENIDVKSKYYYDKRKEYNDFISSHTNPIYGAALFLFLNKAGYNGMYRVNSKGEFNIPFGKRQNITLYDEDVFTRYSCLLKNATIACGDFEAVCENLGEGDFVYFDSPYYDTFDTYQAGGFSEDDHRRLFELFKRLTENGVKCMLSNSDADFIKDLYKEYNIQEIPVKRMINCKGNNRVGNEILVKNY